MPLFNELLDIGGDAMASAAPFLSIHTADPATTGNESTAARQPANWAASVNGGDFTATNITFTGGAPSGPALTAGLWTQEVGGDLVGSIPLTGDQTFNAAGEYVITSLTANGSSSDA